MAERSRGNFNSSPPTRPAAPGQGRSQRLGAGSASAGAFAVRLFLHGAGELVVHFRSERMEVAAGRWRYRLAHPHRASTFWRITPCRPRTCFHSRAPARHGSPGNGLTDVTVRGLVPDGRAEGDCAGLRSDDRAFCRRGVALHAVARRERAGGLVYHAARGGRSSMHFLARPHLFTLLLVPVCFWVLEADRRERTRWLWVLIPVTALWTNLHGGFRHFPGADCAADSWERAGGQVWERARA